MDAIEKRAREIIATQYRKAGDHLTAQQAESGWEKSSNPLLQSVIAALTPPEGFVLVPVAPTDEMLLAAHRADTTRAPITSRWSAMLAARPEVKP